MMNRLSLGRLKHLIGFAAVIGVFFIASRTLAATFTITATVSGHGGSISPEGDQTVTAGSDVSFTITANNGYDISSVLVDSVDQGAIASFSFTNVQTDHTIDASFVAKDVEYTITATAGPGGTISPSGTVYAVNGYNSQLFQYTPISGYALKEVIIDGTVYGAIGPYTFPASTDSSVPHTIQANFYDLTPDSGSSGCALAVRPDNVSSTLIWIALGMLAGILGTFMYRRRFTTSVR